jgi:hypothetical protein
VPAGQRTFDLPAEHIFQGNQSRRGSGPTTIELDERWRAEMPAVAQWTTIALTWPLLVWYGYLPRR